jgi:hypothetical protein
MRGRGGDLARYTCINVWLAMLLLLLYQIDTIITGAITSGHECHTLCMLGGTLFAFMKSMSVQNESGSMSVSSRFFYQFMQASMVVGAHGLMIPMHEMPLVSDMHLNTRCTARKQVRDSFCDEATLASSRGRLRGYGF